MRIILFMNNWGGWQLARWLRERGDEIIGVVIHQEADQRFASQIVSALDLPADRIWRAPELRTPELVAKLRGLRPDIGISGWFGYVLKPEVLELFRKGCVNLHAAYLPWNRGWHTNVWPILDGSPAGVTLHYIDEGIDTGDLIAQREVSVGPTETAGSLHQRLTNEIIALFKETWPLIVAGRIVPTPQDHSLATRHKRGDLAALDCIDLKKEYRARELLNLLRARTYAPFPAAYYLEDSHRVYVRVALSEAETGSAPAGSHIERCIDLEQRYEARELLSLLLGGSDDPSSAAYFMHGSGRVYVRAQLATEADIDPAGNPPWLPAETERSAAEVASEPV
jgi:methionyl-tRNA formyltransferase